MAAPSPFRESSEGPTLYQMVNQGGPPLVPVSVEYAVELKLREDPSFAEERDRLDWSEDKEKEYAGKLEGNKIGGTPFFLQSDEFPEDGPWDLLLQLDSTNVPFGSTSEIPESGTRSFPEIAGKGSFSGSATDA